MTQTLLAERMATRGRDGEMQQAQAQRTLEVVGCHRGVGLGRRKCRCVSCCLSVTVLIMRGPILFFCVVHGRVSVACGMAKFERIDGYILKMSVIRELCEGVVLVGGCLLSVGFGLGLIVVTIAMRAVLNLICARHIIRQPRASVVAIASAALC